MIGAKCEGPAFMVDPILSYFPNDYEIYWAEWDLSMMEN